MKLNHFITVVDATFGHGAKPIGLRPLSFSLPTNKVVALIGPNGSGKSTFLKALVGEKTLLSGSLFLGSERVRTNRLHSAPWARLVAFIPQELVYPPHLTVWETMKTAFLAEVGWFRALPADDDPRLRDSLRIFALENLKDKALTHLSSGERQRVFLARAFLQSAEILLLDEPTSHLDPGSTRSFSQALRTGHSVGKQSILLATHDLQLVESVADWVVALSAKGLHYCGPLKANDASQLFQQIFHCDE